MAGQQERKLVSTNQRFLFLPGNHVGKGVDTAAWSPPGGSVCGGCCQWHCSGSASYSLAKSLNLREE